MAKTRQQKELTVTELVEKLQRSKALVFSNFNGLSVKDATALRRVLRESEIDYIVAKKTLLRKALEQASLDAAIAENLAGGVALAVGYADEVLPAKLLQQFAKDHQAVKLVGGVVEGNWLDGAQVMALAKLPNREAMIAQTVWTIKAPLTGFVTVLAGNLRGLLTVLNARREKMPAA